MRNKFFLIKYGSFLRIDDDDDEKEKREKRDREREREE